MLSTIISGGADIIALVLLFGFTIFVHELGHFLVALWCGMQIDTFSIGFGPAIVKKTVRGVTYKIGWFPLGGYVALPQLDPAGMSTVQGKADDKDADDKDPGSESSDDEKKEEVRVLPPIAAWKKILVALAGATGNVIFALVLAMIIYMSPWEPSEDLGGAVVGFVDTNSAAYHSGLRIGDEIVAVNGNSIESWTDYSTESLLGAREDKDLTLTLKSDGELRDIGVPTIDVDMGVRMIDGMGRSLLCVIGAVMPDSAAAVAGVEPEDIVESFGGVTVVSTEHFIELVTANGVKTSGMVVARGDKQVEITVTPVMNEELGRAVIGVSISAGVMSSSTQWMQYKNPVDQLKGDASGILRILKALTTPKEAKNAAQGLGGPIMIIMALWMSIKVSFLNAIGFLRFLNINLAILNLLPIPVLDGGHIIFALWEGITRRKVSAKLVNILTNIFMILLLSAFLIITFRDVKRAPKVFKMINSMSAEEVQESPTNAVDNAEPPAVPNKED
ncbi:MAG: RIP metalloprotease RseP [Kiritimatiellae bacterium]|nr:RIP metalloprotease RseP [Kiritimatiellia bacterium]